MEHRKLEVTPIESITDKMQVPQLLNNMKMYILSLDRYDNYSGEDSACFIRQIPDGEYIKLEDVLALFSAKKE